MSEELNANIWEDQARRYLKDLEETKTERDDLRTRLADAQARAERAEGERDRQRSHVKAAYVAGMTIECRHRSAVYDKPWEPCNEPQWLVEFEYRIALTPAPQGLTDKQLTGELLINTNDKTIQWILGLPCFFCAPIAHILVKDGHSIEAKAEAEQAYVIPWLIRKYHEHGKCEEWKAKVDAELNAIKRKHMDATAPEVKGGAA